MEQFVVRLDRASSLTGVAFIGPGQCDGFKVDNIGSAARFGFDDAARFADHFRGQWRGFHGFSSQDIVVEKA